MTIEREQWKELLSLGIITAIVGGVLVGYRSMEFTAVALAGIVVAVALVSTAMMRLLAISEGILLLEATTVSLALPLIFEQSVQFELIGVALALSFIAGVFFHLAINGSLPRLEPVSADD